jgi:hypothetical protein
VNYSGIYFSIVALLQALNLDIGIIKHSHDAADYNTTREEGVLYLFKKYPLIHKETRNYEKL